MIYKTALKVAHTLDAKGNIKTEEIQEENGDSPEKEPSRGMALAQLLGLI